MLQMLLQHRQTVFQGKTGAFGRMLSTRLRVLNAKGPHGRRFHTYSAELRLVLYLLRRGACSKTRFASGLFCIFVNRTKRLENIINQDCGVWPGKQGNNDRALQHT